jgi:outer membrane immunogenic protein
MNCKLVTLLAAVALGTVAQAASAADLPPAPVHREPAMVPVVANWTGVYAGLGGGYGVYNADTNSAATVGGALIATNNGRTGGRGWFGTAQIGADVQFADRWVVGIFGDYDFSSIDGTAAELSGVGLVPLKQTSAWSAGARIGLLVAPQFLTYYSGGYTSARFEMGRETNQSPPVGAFSGVTWPDQDFSGYFLGSGLEYMIFPGWFVKTEYRYASYSSKTFSGAISPPAPGVLTAINMTVKPQVQTVRTELVYKFNWTR